MTPGETPDLTGWLYEAAFRGRSEDDYAFSGHLRVEGRDYQVRVYGPSAIRGTARRRWWLKLTPTARVTPHDPVSAAARAERAPSYSPPPSGSGPPPIAAPTSQREGQS